MRNTAIGILAVAILIFGGCAPKRQSPSSSIHPDKAHRIAAAAALLVGGEVVKVAPTGSMEPTMNGQTYTAIEHCRFEDISPGDIVVFSNGADLVIHRVVEGGRTQGDANAEPDRWPLDRTTFRGRVVAIVYGRRLTQAP